MNAHAGRLHEPPERAAAAAEYVLGVFGAAERRAAEERIARDAVFAREVAAWERRLLPLIDEIEPVPVPPALWSRIRAAAGLAPDVPPAQSPTRPLFWRWLAAGAFAVALASLFFVPRLTVPPPVAPMVATLVRDDGEALFLVTVEVRHGTMVVQPTTVEVPAGRVLELWLIPPGDSPHSLGIIDHGKANAVVVPRHLIAASGLRAVVAVTVEPPGGGPGGKPSGPVIAKGELLLL